MTREAGRAVLIAVLAGACDSPAGPDPIPAERFGAVTAVIGGRQWGSSYFPDSTIAFFSPATGELQITGQQVTAEIWPTLRLRAESSGGPAAYPIVRYGGLASGEWYEPESGERPRGDAGMRGYLSTGAVGDSLVIEELDMTTRVIRGRFSFTARLLRSDREVRLTGRFAGRVLLPAR